MFKYTFKPVDKVSSDIEDIKMLVNKSLGLDMSDTMSDQSSNIIKISSEKTNDSGMIAMHEKSIFTKCCSPISRYERELDRVMQSSWENNVRNRDTKSAIKKIEIKYINKHWNCESHVQKIESRESSENEDNSEHFINLQCSQPKYKNLDQMNDVDESFELFSSANSNLSSIHMLQNKFDFNMENNEISSLHFSYENNLDSYSVPQNLNQLSLKYTQNSSDMCNVDVAKNVANVSEFLMKGASDIITEITENVPAKYNVEDAFLCMTAEDKSECSLNISSEEIEENIETMFPVVNLNDNNRNMKHVCPKCSKCFRFSSQLKKHIRSHKLSENVSQRKQIRESTGKGSAMSKSNCRESKKESNSSKIEMRKKKSAQKCHICSRTFKFFSKLTRHLKTHADSKPYTCQFCSKTFLEKFNLRAHINIHKNEKSYVCNFCQRSFNFKSNLTRHLRSHTKKKPFICNKCGDAYSSEKSLIIHSRSHEKILHKCTECEKSFKKKSNLKRHTEIHLNKRRYPCDLCDYAANQTSHLKRHIKRNHKN